MGAGIDYGMGKTNIDTDTGIRYGVISQHEVLQAWADSSEPEYPEPRDLMEDLECPECGFMFSADPEMKWGDTIVCPDNSEHEWDLEMPDMEPMVFVYDEGGIEASCGEDGDIFVMKSPYYTLCQFCSPCAPGAGYLMSPDPDGVKAYCFDHEWFDDGKAPYPVYRVKDDALVEVEDDLCPQCQNALDRVQECVACREFSNFREIGK